MNMIQSLEKRRSYYNIQNNLSVSNEEVEKVIKQATELVPDAFNMKSARVVTLFGEHHEKLWNTVYEVFDGNVPEEKIDSFRSGAGTILFFYDGKTVDTMKSEFPPYAQHFTNWANQANGMLQISVWTALRELGIGASLQHYNPVIDQKVKELFDIPEEYVLLSQMPFGAIGMEPEAKEKENVENRVRILQ